MVAVTDLCMHELTYDELMEVDGGLVLATIGGIAITTGFVVKCVATGFTAGVAIGIAYYSKKK